MYRLLILIAFILVSVTPFFSQSSITLQPGPEEGKDCEIFSLNPNTNYVSNLLRGNAWTWSGVSGLERGLFEFDLTGLPQGAVIDSAYLYLYAPKSPSTEFHSGNNGCFLKRITSSWSESSVTWSNQPSTTDNNQVTLSKSTSGYQNYLHIDVTNLVRDMKADPANSFGFMIRQQVEQIRRRMTFCSSDYPDVSKRPKLVVFYSVPTSGCTTITLQPHEEGKDCEIFSLSPNTNYVSNLLRGNAWTWSGTPGLERGLIQFDLSLIPQGAVIQSAYLDLYSPHPPSTEFHSGTNSSFLKRITSDWKENTVTWNNQPGTTDVNQVSLSKSTSPYQDYLHIDVRNMVKDMIASPNKSFGFMIQQQVEQIYRRMTFCSGDYPDQAKHPRLVICYSPVEDCTMLVLQPGPAGNDAEVFSLLPNTNYVSNLLRGNSWTFSGKPGTERGLIQFDLSSIPLEASITSARLSLYSPGAFSTQFHSGTNHGYLQRIVAPWSESSVTWKNQPSTTTEHEVSLPMSIAPYQDYIDIDVASLVQDMVDDPLSSFGFMIKLQEERIYRRLSFCSGDYPDSAKHPKLEICYDYHPRTAEVIHSSTSEFTLFPNPTSDWIQINIPGEQQVFKLQIMDYLGRTILDTDISDHEQIDLGDYPPSIYVFRISNLNNEVLHTSKVTRL